MAGQGLQFIPLGRSIPKEWDAAWFAKFIREVLAQADVRNALEGPGISISGQPGDVATISASADIQNLLLQSYVTATASTFLPNERILDGENGVVSITDNGPGSLITVGLFDGGVPYSKLNEIDELSVLGNPTPDFGPLTPINGTAEHEVLSVQLNGSDLEVRFGTITHQSVSDFDEAAQDAVGGILTDTATIDFTYTDATPSITASVKNDSITYAMMQNTSAASVLLGRGSASAGDPQEITLGAGLAMTGTTLAVSGGAGTVVGCQVERRATLSVPTANTEVMIPWDTEIVDDGAYWASSPNPTRFTIPFTGWYVITSSVTTTGATGTWLARIAINGGAIATYSVRARTEAQLSESRSLVVAGSFYLTAGDYVEIGVQANTSSRSLDGATASIVKFP